MNGPDTEGQWHPEGGQTQQLLDSVVHCQLAGSPARLSQLTNLGLFVAELLGQSGRVAAADIL